MQWREAKRRTIDLWRGIHDAVGEADSLEILADINAVNDLCGRAAREARAHGDLVQCHFCPAYQQYGGCREVCAELSELVVRKEWDDVRDQIREFIGVLEKVETPAG